QRRNAVPTQLQVIVQSTSDQVKVGIVEPWDCSTLIQIDDSGSIAAERHHLQIGSNSEKLAVTNGNSLDDRPLFILRSDFAVVGNDICGLVTHDFYSSARS